MLTYDERLHFAENGWVLLENVFDAAKVEEFKTAMDRAAQMRRCLHTSVWTEELIVLDNIVYFDQVFLEWLTVPRLIEANTQLLGTRMRFEAVYSHIKQPHADRHMRAFELADPESWKWHRDMRPKWGTLPDDNDPRLVNCSFLNNVTYLTDVSPGNGSTALLSGSHRLEGKYPTVRDRCRIDVPTAKAGSVLIFSETLLHSAVPILSENVRYNMYYCFSPPWFRCWKHMHMPKALVEQIADEKLRFLFEQPSYEGQYPEL